jgi:succinyl-CoA synthetase beta subunit
LSLPNNSKKSTVDEDNKAPWEEHAMQLHEFQAKKLLSRYSIGIPVGSVAVTPDEAEAAAAQLNSTAVFVKAQIQAGDRSTAGGIRGVQSAVAAKAAAKELLGKKLVTSQTAPNGQTVKRVLIEAGIQAVRELYLAMRVDTLSGSIMLTAGEGGMQIPAGVPVRC